MADDEDAFGSGEYAEEQPKERKEKKQEVWEDEYENDAVKDEKEVPTEEE